MDEYILFAIIYTVYPFVCYIATVLAQRLTQSAEHDQSSTELISQCVIEDFMIRIKQFPNIVTEEKYLTNEVQNMSVRKGKKKVAGEVDRE